MKKTITMVVFLLGGLIIGMAIGRLQIHLSQGFRPVLHRRCLSTQPLKNSGFSGTLVLLRQDPDGRQIISKLFSAENILLDLRTGEARLVDAERPNGQFAVSPDGKLLSYVRLDGNKRTLVILDAQNNKKTLELELNEYPANWLSNKKFALGKNGSDEQLPEMLLLDVDTMQTQVFPPSGKTNITPLQYELWNNIWVLPETYSPDIKYVLRLTKPSVTGQHPIMGDNFFADLVLSRSGKAEEIVRFQDIFKLDSVIWRQDSSGFFLVRNNYDETRDESHAEILLVDNNGTVVWNFNLADLYQPAYMSFHISALSLSPNEHWLTFTATDWSKAVLYNKSSLLLNTRTGDVFDFCLLTHYPGMWSPDSRYEALASNDNLYGGGAYQTVILDLNGQKLYSVRDGYVPAGWLK